MEDYEKTLMAEHIATIDKTIENAFLHHFGFPIQEVKDREELEHIVVQGDPIESFRYRGETFLYMCNNDIKVDDSPDKIDVILTTRFKEV